MAQGSIRVLVLWHMHQPFYKDLASGVYRLPWVRLHALKDYYGMVKLLEEFPEVHQNFNLVPSLVAQIEDYSLGLFKDPFWEVAAKPASELTAEEKHFALSYLFQAHVERMIGRYPRYRQLCEQVHAAGRSPESAAITFSERDYRDLQVLSQIAWFDEYFLEEPEIRKLIAKGKGYSEQDQHFVMGKQHEILRRVLPAYREAAQRGAVELSTTPFYHPILPLVCDTNAGRVSSPGLALPNERYRRPDDAEEQVRRALETHQRCFGARPVGMWPSEGSVSDEVLGIASGLGVQWMATDEEVLGRTLGHEMHRSADGFLDKGSASLLYNIHRWESDGKAMNLIFRDHRISDLIGFVYAGMGSAEAAGHLLETIRHAAAPVVATGRDAVVPIILDGENAWESYEGNGRDFLRRFYDGLRKEPQMEALTVAEALARQTPESFGKLRGLVPGSWINANFNVWIGAPEDNKAWDYLSQAREYYDDNASRATEEQRKTAFEELLIAEGSDWNWWYGPEHHSVNDSDFDELYRKHLSNVYTTLGGVPPDHLARPISALPTHARIVRQSAFVRPPIDGQANSYFGWMGAAMYTSDHRGGSMHGHTYLLDAIHAGIDEAHLFARLDFVSSLSGEVSALTLHLALREGEQPVANFQMEAEIAGGELKGWELRQDGKTKALASSRQPKGCEAALGRVLELKLPMVLLEARQGQSFNLRFVAYRDHLPMDAMPEEGSLEIQIAPQEVLEELAYES